MLRRKPTFGARGLAVAMASASLLWGNALLAQEQQDADDEELALEEVIVTGSIIKRPETATASPVSVLTEQELDVRGINTVADAVVMLPANNAGTMNTSWSTWGFTPGASAVSLRGLTTSATLTIFDGMRMAPYPLSDDGRRNFVDLNTIPDSITERIEVLKDGASSTYGADAVAGVVNVITKKEITGMHLNGSYGVSQEGDGDEWRGDFTFGFGELDDQGFNFYVNVEAQRQEAIFAPDRDYPFNTWDWSSYCNENGVCMDNGNINGLQYDGTIFGVSSTGSPNVAMVRPYEAGVGSLGNWQLLNPADGCREELGLGNKLINPSNAADVGLTGPVCEWNVQQLFGTFPQIDRRGFNARYTQRLGDNHEFYAMFNYYNVETSKSGGTPYYWGGTTPPGPGETVRVSVSPFLLPVYVCPLGAEGYATCDASNGTLNPNNPFAADGQMAQVSMRFPFPRDAATDSESYRYAFGITGTFGRDDMWDYAVDIVSSQVEVDLTRSGYPIPRNMLNVAYDGSFNFVDPTQNSQEMWDYVAPPYTNTSKSDVDQIQATIARPLFEMWGGTMIAAAGVSYREESLYSPSANPPKQDPYARYLSMNAVAAAGERDVTSVFFELDMPVLESLLFNFAGRWDDYSTGQDNFAPKVGLQWAATDWLRLRGTYSEGFRIPSFNEAFGAPTTGYISHSVDCSADWGQDFCNAHDNNQYVQGTYSVGLTASGNPELDPEESDSYTVGIVLEPTSNVSLTLDYWNIEVENLISGADYAPALTEYYANNGVVTAPGIDAVVPGAVDPDFPNALPLIGFIQYSYQNADSEIAEGIDLGVNFAWDFGGIYFTSHLETSYLMELSKTIGGVKDNYEGTLSPCDVTSCSGAPDWRATWVNGIEWNKWTFALTANYTGSYDNASVDYGGVPGDCENNVGVSVWYYADNSPFKCTHDSYLDWDFSTSFQLSEGIQLYANILNLLDEEPTFDPASTYHLYGFNPAWELSAWRGRFFRVGVKLDF